jgi:hypothetical protein
MKKLVLLFVFLAMAAAAALAAPTVTGVSPASFPRTWIGTLTISGSGFQSGATVYVGDGVSNALTGSSSMSTTFVSSSELDVYIRCHSGAVLALHDVEVHNPDGGVGTLESAFTVTAAPADGPTVSDVYFDGVAYTSGMEISPRPMISATITDASGLTQATSDLKILLDNVVTYDNLSDEVDVAASNTSATFYYRLPSDLPGFGIREIYINVKDTSGNPGEAQCVVNIQTTAATGQATVVERVLPSQTVCAPTPDEPVDLQYKLDGPAEVTIRIIGSTPVLTRKVQGQTGYNKFSWDGTDDREGSARNGLYVIGIEANGKVIGKGKIVVYR